MARVLRVRVKPNARSSSLRQEPDGTWVATVKAAPADGKANRELIAIVADHFGCSKSAVAIKSGTSARTKVLEIR